MGRVAVLLAVLAPAAGVGCRKRPAPPTAPDSEPPPRTVVKPAPVTPPPRPPEVVEKTTFHPYQSPDGRFTASFPWVPPAVQTRTVVTPHGPVVETLYETKTFGGSAAVRVSDWDTPALAGVDLDRVVAAGRDAVAQAVGGTVTRDTRADVGGVAARDVTIEAPGRPGQGPIYFRYLVRGRRLYTVGILIDRGTVSPADRDRFFDSVTILK